ncbi:TRAP transporter small permease [Pelobacter seleniigenes]|uniref:TRAP transporter small permease n=1 Tax=Pelobacter seleniigenes TaxID=407188 RepID=UPI00068A2C95|nr:TRAP transporter small permease [Pelobacter seleniigenes]
MELLRSFNTIVNSILSKVITIGFMLMTVIIFFQIIFRYALHESLSWSEELARYFFIWVTFLGASVAFHERTHINVDLFINYIKSSRVRAALFLFGDLLSLSFLMMLVVEGISVAIRVFKLDQVSASMDFLPIGLIYLAVPLGCLFMTLNIIMHAGSHVRELLKPAEEGE